MPRKKTSKEEKTPEPEPEEGQEPEGSEGPWGEDNDRDAPPIIRLRTATLSTVKLEAGEDDTPVLKLSFRLNTADAEPGFDLLSGLWKKTVDLVVIPAPLRANDVPEDQLRFGEGEE